MASIRKHLLLILTLSIFFQIQLLGQTTSLKDSIRTTYIDAAKEIMTKAGTCALITLDDEGIPRVRVMDPFAPEEDLIVWFGTKHNTRKVEQIKKDPRVTLYYFDSESVGYVTIHGKAYLVDDAYEKKKRWKEQWEAFYKNRNEDYLLIKVSPKWMEVVSYKHNILGDSVSWKPPRVDFIKD